MKNFLLSTLLSLLPVLAIAYDAEIDGIYYIFSGDEAKVTYEKVTHHKYILSPFNSDNDYYSGAVVIPDFVTYNGKTYEVTSIDDDAFFIAAV